MLATDRHDLVVKGLSWALRELAKRDPESYRKIAGALECLPPQVLFVSDVVEELEAARATAMHTVLCVRPGSRRPEAPGMQVIETFDELFA